jgi:hypothetical protein
MRRHYHGEAVQVVNEGTNKGVRVLCIMFSDAMAEWVPASEVTK